MAGPQVVIGVRVGQDPCKSEVANLGIELAVLVFLDEDVLWLEITVNDVALVDLNQSVDHVREDSQDALSVKHSFGVSVFVLCDEVEARSLVSFVKIILQGLARAEFHLDHQVD